MNGAGLRSLDITSGCAGPLIGVQEAADVTANDEPAPADLSCVNEYYNVIFWNVHGFGNLSDLTHDEITENFSNCAMLGFTESWLSEKIRFLPNFLSKFECFEVPATKSKAIGRACGGIGMLIDTNIFSSPHLFESCDSYVAVKCKRGQTDLILVVVYLNTKNFGSDLEKLEFFCQPLLLILRGR